MDLATGDRVWVDPLTGAEPSRLLPVVVGAGDLVGSLAYVTRRDAVRLAGEHDTYTTLRLKLDRDARPSFFERLRQTPGIAAIGDKTAMLEQFRKTTARNLLAFTGILSVFAAAIAIGVVYNAARIALAEHAWELATLRVLGCRRDEVSGILLGQLGVQMLAAIPLGCVLGYGLSLLIVALIRTEDLRIPLVILPSTYAYSALVTIVAGVISALVVRRRIDTLDLVAVLKTRE
jgi:putative ABC transport system permease protein